MKNKWVTKISLIILFVLSLVLLGGFTASVSPKSILINEQVNNIQLNKVLTLIDSSDYENAMTELEKTYHFDQLLSIYNKPQFNQLLNQYKTILIQKTTQYINNYEFYQALNLLNSKSKYYKTNQNIKGLTRFCKNAIQSQNLVSYSGEILHIHTRSLLAYPEVALNLSNINYTSLDQNHLTPTEFELMLNQLYNKNYVLINLQSAYKYENGKLTPATLQLPAHKKPLVLSFDDINYNQSGNGFIDKIILDKNYNIATYTGKKSINMRISYNNEYITILENFIEQTPDFSPFNARGVIVLSGQDGILGYKTQKSNTTSKFEIKKATEIVNKLKNLGYTFACGGYQEYNMKTISEIDFTKDLTKWKNEIQEIERKTEEYFYPQNIWDITDENNATNYKQKLLLDNGFKVFCTLNEQVVFGNFPNTNSSKNGLFMGVIVASGQTLRNPQSQLNKVVNGSQIYDYAHRKTPFAQELPT